MPLTKHATYVRSTSVEQKGKDGGAQEGNAVRAALLATSKPSVSIQRTKSAPSVNMSALAARRVVRRTQDSKPEERSPLDGPLSAVRRSVDKQSPVISSNHEKANGIQRMQSNERAPLRNGSRDHLRPVPMVSLSTSDDENAPRFAAKRAFSHTRRKSEQINVTRQATPTEGSLLAAQRVIQNSDKTSKKHEHLMRNTDSRGHYGDPVSSFSLVAAKMSLPRESNGSPSVHYSPASSLEDLFDLDLNKSYGLQVLSKSPPGSPHLGAHQLARSLSPSLSTRSPEMHSSTAAINITRTERAPGSDAEHTVASIQTAQRAAASTPPKPSLSDEYSSITSPFLGPHTLPSSLYNHDNRSSRSFSRALDPEKSRATPDSVQKVHDQFFASKAASRASSRNPSPARRTPLTPAVTSHPTTLRPTLRKEKDHDEKHKRRKVTPAERRRYEALFSSNKNEVGRIDGIIVKNLWSRSQLPQEVLQHAW